MPGTNGDCYLLQRHSYSPISDWWHRVYIEIWGPAIYHACPTVSITHKDFTRYKIVKHNPSVKLEIQCAFIHTCTNKLHLRYWLPLKHISRDNILQFVNTHFIQHFFALHHPPSCVLSHCPSHYYPVAFQDRFAQVFQIYSHRKLADSHFQQKMWPISIYPAST